ncbi:MAG: hypothetical protein ACP5G0_11430 [Desulfomonilia bacterium]
MEVKTLRKVWIFILCIPFIVCAACSSDSGSDGSASAESIYDPGASVGAVGYADAYGIALFVQNEEGGFTPVSDGQYIEPGETTLAVEINGDPERIDRVFLSDGGVYQVEAFLDGDVYTCEYEFSEERLYESVLVQVIHTNAVATKEKYVFKTFQECSEDEFIKNGIGIVLGQEILDSQLMGLEYALDTLISGVFSYIEVEGTDLISLLSFGDGDLSTPDVMISRLEAVQSIEYPQALLRISLTIEDIDLAAFPLYGQNLVTTQDNDLSIDLFAALQDMDGGKRQLVVNFFDSASLEFSKDFFLRPIVEDLLVSELDLVAADPISIDLGELLLTVKDILPGEISVNDTLVDLDELFDKLNMDVEKYLFIDLFGLSEFTTPDALALGAGFYAADYDDVSWGDGHTPPPAEEISLEDMFVEISQNLVDGVFEEIRQEYGILIEELAYGDGNQATDDFVVNSLLVEDTPDPQAKRVSINFTVKNVDFRAVSLFGLALICTQDNDLTIEAELDMQYLEGSTDSGQLVLDVVDVGDVSFSKDFLGRLFIEELVKLDLSNLETMSLNIDEILGDLILEIDFSSFFTGASPEFPDVTPCTPASEWILEMPAAYTLSGVISQSTVNWLLDALVSDGFEWDVNEVFAAIMGEDFEGFLSNGSEDEETILLFSVPPVLDVRSSRIRIVADDLILLYRLEGEPQWEASLDLDLILEVRTNGNQLDFYVSTVPENCHFHVMRDNPGNLGVFDHSNLVNDIFTDLPEMLGGSPDGPVFSIALDSLEPIIVLKDVDDPVRVTSGEGYLYVDGAVEELDLSWIIDLFLLGIME